jgi:hypothetical protein
LFDKKSARDRLPSEVVCWQWKGLFVVRIRFGFKSELSREGRRVASVAKQHRIRTIPRRLQHVAVHEVAASFVLIHSRHHGRSTGHADRSRRVVAIKDNACLGQSVKVRCLHIVIAVASH